MLHGALDRHHVDLVVFDEKNIDYSHAFFFTIRRCK
jgi:hypothetical protein